MVIIPDPEIQSLSAGWYLPYVSGVDMLRLDAIHPLVSGNKWYKLKYNIGHAVRSGHSGILTFGGAYSNHLHAAAAAAKIYGIRSIGIVRGEEGALNPTATLRACRESGMELVYVSRDAYSHKADEDWLETLKEKYGNPFIIPEGGANEYGRRGVEEIASFVPRHYTHICVSAGTGTTFTGLRNALPDSQAMYGYVPMKGGVYLREDIAPYISNKEESWQLFDDWHFGGFGKCNDELICFMNEFYQQHNIPLDVVYTSKMMYGIMRQIEEGYFPKNARILCIHTGGLQGNISVQGKLCF